MLKKVIILLLVTISCNTVKNNTTHPWWQEAVIYQLYPRSFQDTDGNGIGDLNGITKRINYLDSLGIDAIWLNPICASPNDDNGYDISDYKAIMKEMGTMADFDSMLAALKSRNIKLIMDLVLNHSSDEHYWFKQAATSRNNKYYNYYHWWPAEKGTPPKRYSLFDENADAWKYNKPTNSYYLHYFSKKQPDLNWENPILRNEMYDIMDFWLKKGVSGFRLDAFPFMAKDNTWPVKEVNFSNDQFVKYYGADPKVHAYLSEMNEKVLSKYPQVYTVGEGGVIPFSKVMDYIAGDKKQLNTLYHDELGNIWGRNAYDKGEYVVGKNNVVGLKEITKKWDNKFAQKGWNTIYLTNHDQSRAVSRYGNDSKYRTESAKMLITFLLTQRATPYLYNGDEIGMANIRFKNIEQYNDLQTRNRYYLALKESKEKAAAYLLHEQELSRDNSRTPMQWDNTLNAGFTTSKPWLPINTNYTVVNAATNLADSNSIFNFTKQLVAFRKKYNHTLIHGTYEIVDYTNPNLFCYTRTSDNLKMLVLLNFTSKVNTFNLAPYSIEKVLINNLNKIQLSTNKIDLLPYQAVIIGLK